MVPVHIGEGKVYRSRNTLTGTCSPVRWHSSPSQKYLNDSVIVPGGCAQKEMSHGRLFVHRLADKWPSALGSYNYYYYRNYWSGG